MKYFEFVNFNDIHIEVHSRYVDDYLKPIENVFNQIISYCRNNGVKHVVLGGDIFDNPNPKKSSQILFLNLLLNSGLTWHIILGNHEYIYTNKDEDDLSDENAFQLIKFFEEANLLDNINIYMKPCIKKIDGIKVRFLPFPYYEYKPDVQAITFGHFSVNGYISDNGIKVKDGMCDKSQINPDLTLLGHLHTPQLPLYPGSILQCNFGENNNKGFVHCTAIKDSKGLRLEQKWIPIVLPFELVNVAIEKEDDLSLLKKYKDQKYRIKLLIKNGVAIPPSLLVQYPNIVSTKGYNNNNEKLALQSGMLVNSEVKTTQLDEKELLKQFLKSKGLTDKKVKKCVKLLDHSIGEKHND